MLLFCSGRERAFPTHPPEHRREIDTARRALLSDTPRPNFRASVSFFPQDSANGSGLRHFNRPSAMSPFAVVLRVGLGGDVPRLRCAAIPRAVPT